MLGVAPAGTTSGSRIRCRTGRERRAASPADPGVVHRQSGRLRGPLASSWIVGRLARAVASTASRLMRVNHSRASHRYRTRRWSSARPFSSQPHNCPARHPRQYPAMPRVPSPRNARRMPATTMTSAVAANCTQISGRRSSMNDERERRERLGKVRMVANRSSRRAGREARSGRPDVRSRSSDDDPDAIVRYVPNRFGRGLYSPRGCR